MLALFRTARRTDVALRFATTVPKAIHSTNSESDYASVHNHYTLWFRAEIRALDCKSNGRGETIVSPDDDPQVRMDPSRNP